MMNLMQLLQHRRSIRVYKDEKVDDNKLKQILQAGLLSASSRNLKPWEFIVVKDRKMLEQMSKCRIGAARMLAGADCAVVVLADEEATDTWVEDCSIAMTNMQLMADSLGVGSCWVQGRLRTDATGRSTESYLRYLLDFPKEYKLEAILSLGMPGEVKTAHDLNELTWDKIHYEAY